MCQNETNPWAFEPRLGFETEAQELRRHQRLVKKHPLRDEGLVEPGFKGPFSVAKNGPRSTVAELPRFPSLPRFGEEGQTHDFPVSAGHRACVSNRN